MQRIVADPNSTMAENLDALINLNIGGGIEGARESTVVRQGDGGMRETADLEILGDALTNYSGSSLELLLVS